MADAVLGATWRMELEVLSPLHVGAGGPPLVYDYDFVARRGEVVVIDLDRALERVPDERLPGLVDARLSRLLGADEYGRCARYRLRSREEGAPAEVIACARDVDDRPYLPGSSLKGALRTALASALAGEDSAPDPFEALGPNPKYAALPFERRLFGPDPNHDLLRALRVADAAVDGAAEAELSPAAVYSLREGRLVPKGQAYRWHLEVLPAGTRFVGAISLDERLFRAPGGALPPHRREWLADTPRHCRAFARQIALAEEPFYARAGLPAVATFYRGLIERLDAAPPGEGLVQLGWGTGWTAKTLGLSLRRDRRFPELVRRYQLDRGRGDEVFPRTRRLVERGNTPDLPLGWAWFRLQPSAPNRRAAER